MNTKDRAQVERIAAQIGSSLMPDSPVWVNRFTVESTSSKSVYTVAQRRSDGVWGCSCRGWTHYRHCKHVADILARLAALDTAQLEPAVAEMLGSARTAYLDLEAGPHKPIKHRTEATRVLDL